MVKGQTMSGKKDLPVRYAVHTVRGIKSKLDVLYLHAIPHNLERMAACDASGSISGDRCSFRYLNRLHLSLDGSLCFNPVCVPDRKTAGYHNMLFATA